MKLYEQFARPGFHTSISTTFCIDFDAYESVALSRLRGAGCTNNIVLMDSRMMVHTLDTASVLPAFAGSQYTLNGAVAAGVFHPKILLQLGKKSGRLTLGSANLTAPGLGGNLEIVGSIGISSGDEAGRRLIASAWRYISGFIDVRQEALAYQIEWMQQRTGWLFDTEPDERPQPLVDGGAAMFLAGAGDTGIAARFAALAGSKVKRLIVISPYWDEDLAALRHLASSLKADKILLLVDEQLPLFPTQAIRKDDGFRIHSLADFAKGRFVHAKVLIAQAGDADHVLFGSANCTVAALGKRGFRGTNAEACLYRRLRPGAAIKALRLESVLKGTAAIDKSRLPAFAKIVDLPLANAEARDPGRFEASDGTLRWWPSPAFAGGEGIIELLGINGGIVRCELFPAKSHGDWLAFSTRGETVAAQFARVRLGAVVSAPKPLVLLDELRRVVRDPRGKAAQCAVDRLSAESEEGLWLLEIIELFAQEEAEARPSKDEGAPRVGKGRHSADAARSHTKLTYEEFMAGRKLRGRVDSFPPSELQQSDLSFVRHFLNRMLGFLTPRMPAVDEAAERAALDHDADPEDIETNVPVPHDMAQERKPRDQLRARAAAAVAAREQIVAAITDFDEAFRGKAIVQGLTSRDVLRFRALLMISLAASRPRNAAAYLPIQVLDATGPVSWTRLVGRVLSSMFGREDPAIRRLEIGRIHEELPVEILECWATAFWAINACRSSVPSTISERGLLDRLQDLSVRIYREVALDADQLQGETVSQMYESLSRRYGGRLQLETEVMLVMHREAIRKLLNAASHQLAHGDRQASAEK